MEIINLIDDMIQKIIKLNDDIIQKIIKLIDAILVEINSKFPLLPIKIIVRR